MQDMARTQIVSWSFSIPFWGSGDSTADLVAECIMVPVAEDAEVVPAVIVGSAFSMVRPCSSRGSGKIRFFGPLLL